MSQAVDLEVFYPHSPERVWQVLTNRRTLAAWMMENDFEPKLGHKFRFYSQPLPGLKTAIQCEVVELEEPTRLAYTWQEAATTEPALVVWTLTPVAGGTQLRLKHYQYSYTTAAAIPNRSGSNRSVFNRSSIVSGYSGEYSGEHSGEYYQPLSGASTLEVIACDSFLSRRIHSGAAGLAIGEVFAFHPFSWDHLLKHRLPDLLAQDEPIRNSD